VSFLTAAKEPLSLPTLPPFGAILFADVQVTGLVNVRIKPLNIKTKRINNSHAR
jgi:hypothetical protein